MKLNREDYLVWKETHPEEWNECYNIFLDMFKKSAIGKNYYDVMFESLNRDKGQQLFTYGRVALALMLKNDCCDDLVFKCKAMIDYKQEKK